MTKVTTKRSEYLRPCRIYTAGGYKIKITVPGDVFITHRLGRLYREGFRIEMDSYRKEVENFNEIAIPRCHFKATSRGFSDSSTVYMKSVSQSNTINIQLVAAKSRL